MNKWAKVFREHVRLTVTQAPPGFEVQDVYLDEEVLGEALAQGKAQEGQFALRFDVAMVWDAVRVVDGDGMIWTTPDKGETWLNPFDRMMKEIASNG